MKFTQANKELARIINSTSKAMQGKAGSVGKSFKVVTNKDSVGVQMPYYAKYVDSGRAKGISPPPSKLKKWSESKGLNEYAVAANIKKYGIKAKNFLYLFEDTFIKNENKLADAGLNDTFKMLNKIIDKK